MKPVALSSTLSPSFYSALSGATSTCGFYSVPRRSMMVSTSCLVFRSRMGWLSLAMSSRSGEKGLLTCVNCKRLSTSSLSQSVLTSAVKVIPQHEVVRRQAARMWDSKRFLWGWLNSIFNRVDPARVKEVGPDRACAEWLLRCGAGVKWDRAADEWLRDYNSLPVGHYRTLKILEIDATNSAVMHIGFPHFEGLTTVKKATFHSCMYLEDEAVRQIGRLKGTLEELQISSCGNVTDDGILTLVQMKNLKRLKLYDFLEVRDRKHCLSVLQKSLPNCDISFPFARESDKEPETAVEQKK